MIHTPEIKSIDLQVAEIDSSLAQLLGFEYASKYAALPVKQEHQHLWVAMSDPHNFSTLQDLSDITNMYIIPMQAKEQDIRYHVNKIFAEEEINSIASQFLVDERIKHRTDFNNDPAILAEISEAPAVRFLDSIIDAAILNHASDIHIEPFESYLRARFRVDGQLYTFSRTSISLLPNVISRLKIMGDMDIAERRLPQDGHFTMHNLDFRLSTLPTIYGEKAAIRILYNQATLLKKEDLGFFPKDLAQLTDLFNQPHGAIFMTGPTGSGKSTTLGSFLSELNSEEINIVTVEEPVENSILGVNHVNIERAAGMDFGNALKHILRQDPDIIMVGEIRDEETAKIAIQAALTGHVVLSTLHTNDAPGVVERLLDMKIKPYLVASALSGVISQRLVRKICQDCRRATALSPRHAQFFGLPESTVVYEGTGCKRCNNTGFRGRFAVYEYIIITDEIRRRICDNPAALTAELRKQGDFNTCAIRNLQMGRTTAEEVMRVLSKQ